MLFRVLMVLLGFSGAAYASELKNPTKAAALSMTDKLTECDRVAGLPAEIGNHRGVDFGNIDPNIAITACKKDIEHSPNNARLLFNLGRAEDVGKDYVAAIDHYKQAIQNGSMYAIFNLGQMYEFGSGVQTNYNIAFKYYLKSARCGDARAVMRIGTFFARGLVVALNKKMALKWYLKASELDSADAMYYMAAELADRCKEYAVESAQYDHCRSSSNRWYMKAAKHGNADAMRELGTYYRFQNWADIDPRNPGPIKIPSQHGQTEALKWYREAAEHGSILAMLEISTVDENIDEAVEWFLKGLRKSETITYPSFLWVNNSADFQKAFEVRLTIDGLYTGEISRSWNKKLEQAFQKLIQPANNS